MSCEQVRQALSQAIDGELSPGPQADEMDEHVRGCAGCAAFRRHALRFRSRLRFEGVDPATVPDVVPAVLAAIRDEPPQPMAPGPADGDRFHPRRRRRSRPEEAPSHSGIPMWRSRLRRGHVRVGAGSGWRIGAAAAAGLVLGATMVGLARDRDGSRFPTDVAGQASGLAEPANVLLAWTPEALDPTVAEAARAMPQVTAVSSVDSAITDLVASHDAAGRPVDAPAPGWAIPLDTIAVDPVVHARFAPLADQATVASLGSGEALLGRTSAELRRLGPGSTIELAAGQELSVVGVVDDAAVGAAELAVSQGTGRQIGVDRLRYVLMAHAGARRGLERSLRRALPADERIRFRQPGETAFMRNRDAVLPPVLLKQRFGEFAYQAPAPGQREFVQDPAWQAEHIVERDVPLIGRMRCHRAVLDAIAGAVGELQARGLGDRLDPGGYRGCWNPRLVQPGGDLSHHAWGVAFDVNYDSETGGAAADQDPLLVEVLARWGFAWGGEWLVSDPAHFEYARPPAP